MMLDIARTIVASLIIAAAAWPPPALREFQRPSPSEILSAAAERGKALMAALENYTYYAELSVQTVSQADTITGKYYRFSQISYDRNGNLQETVLENTSTLPADVHIGTQTYNHLTLVYLFILTPKTLNQYELNYVGRERIDELDTLVFDVKPKGKLLAPDLSAKLYLKGRVWIDQQDLCVVKVSGQAVPQTSPDGNSKFETYFQNHDQYWFPAYTSADETIKVGRYLTRLVVTLRFTGYKKASTR